MSCEFMCTNVRSDKRCYESLQAGSMGGGEQMAVGWCQMMV